jgi:CBS domain-containing protein
MLVRECMTAEVRSVDADATIQEAAEQMRKAAIGCLPVTSMHRLVGVITDRDLVVRGLAHAVAPSTPVRAIMTVHAVTCFADERLEDAVDHMVRGGVRRLVVLDRDQEVVGLLSVDDLAVLQPDGHLAGVVVARTVEQRGVGIGDLLL